MSVYATNRAVLRRIGFVGVSRSHQWAKEQPRPSAQAGERLSYRCMGRCGVRFKSAVHRPCAACGGPTREVA